MNIFGGEWEVLTLKPPFPRNAHGKSAPPLDLPSAEPLKFNSRSFSNFLLVHFIINQFGPLFRLRALNTGQWSMKKGTIRKIARLFENKILN